MLSPLILQSFITIFLVVGTGVFVGWRRIILPDHTKAISRLILYVLLPCLIFANLTSGTALHSLKDSYHALFLGMIMVVIGYGAGFIYAYFMKWDKARKRLFVVMCSHGNSLLLALPIAHLYFGEGSVLSVILYDLGTQFIFWSLGITVITSHLKSNPFRVFFNPNFIAFLISTPIVLIGLAVPVFVLNASQYLGQAVLGLGLLLMGTVLWEMRDSFKAGLFNSFLLSHMLIKLIALPLIAIAIVHLFDVSSMLGKVLVLQAAMPSVVNLLIVAQEYDLDSQSVAMGILVTSVLSLVTIPLFLMAV